MYGSRSAASIEAPVTQRVVPVVSLPPETDMDAGPLPLLTDVMSVRMLWCKSCIVMSSEHVSDQELTGAKVLFIHMNILFCTSDTAVKLLACPL